MPSDFPSDPGNNTYRLVVLSAVARLPGASWENEGLTLLIGWIDHLVVVGKDSIKRMREIAYLAHLGSRVTSDCTLLMCALAVTLTVCYTRESTEIHPLLAHNMKNKCSVIRAKQLRQNAALCERDGFFFQPNRTIIASKTAHYETL